jgi:DNA-binding FrmR family transcriptional regulator
MKNLEIESIKGKATQVEQHLDHLDSSCEKVLRKLHDVSSSLVKAKQAQNNLYEAHNKVFFAI